MAKKTPSTSTDGYWIYVEKGPHGYSPHTGKWLLFISRPKVDQIWSEIEAATRAGRLGCAAKVATAKENPHATSAAHVICVYTSDYRDLDDVRRVLAELRTLGFAARIFYKEDAATAANRYGQGRASLYESPRGTEIVQRRDPFPPEAD